MQDNEFIITAEMVAQMRDAIKQMEEAKKGLSERVEAVAKFYNSPIADKVVKIAGFKLDLERFVGYIGYHKIDWKPLNSASFERLLHEFYREEIIITKSSLENGTPIDEQQILKIERIGKAILHESTPSHQMEKKLQKAGRPKEGVNDLHEDIYKEFLRLTLSNDKIIEKPLAVTRLTTSFGDKFKTKNIDSIKASINRIIREKANNN